MVEVLSRLLKKGIGAAIKIVVVPSRLTKAPQAPQQKAEASVPTAIKADPLSAKKLWTFRSFQPFLHSYHAHCQHGIL